MTGKLIVYYDMEADEMPDNCAVCPLISEYVERCPCEVWYWKRGDMPAIYSKYQSRRHRDCPLTFVDIEVLKEDNDG